MLPKRCARQGVTSWSSPVTVQYRQRSKTRSGQRLRIFGALDILVNNAGFAVPTRVDGEDYDAVWEKSLAVMASAQQWAARAALPYLLEADHPRIVNVASTEAMGATSYNSPYVVAKHAALGLTRALAVELGKTRYYRQLHLPRADSHRDHRRHTGGG